MRTFEVWNFEVVVEDGIMVGVGVGAEVRVGFCDGMGLGSEWGYSFLNNSFNLNLLFHIRFLSIYKYSIAYI